MDQLLEYMTIVGFSTCAAGWAIGVAIAFRENTAMGLGALFVPLVWLYFVFTRPDKALPAVVVTASGLGIIFLSALATTALG